MASMPKVAAALVSLASLAVLVALLALAVRGVMRWPVRVHSPLPADISERAGADLDDVDVTFSNLSDRHVYRCMRGIMRKLADGDNARTVTVCTGDLPPHSTVKLTAGWDPPGSAFDMCGGKLDRAVCTFTIEDVP